MILNNAVFVYAQDCRPGMVAIVFDVCHSKNKTFKKNTTQMLYIGDNNIG